MWPRVVELMLGAWLIVSPFIFRGTPGLAGHAINDVVCGALVMVFSLLAFWDPLRRANLGTLAVALWLAGYGYFSAPRPGPPAAQNEIVLGLLLLVFALIPSPANQPPDRWAASRP